MSIFKVRVPMSGYVTVIVEVDNKEHAETKGVKEVSNTINPNMQPVVGGVFWTSQLSKYVYVDEIMKEVTHE